MIHTIAHPYQLRNRITFTTASPTRRPRFKLNIACVGQPLADTLEMAYNAYIRPPNVQKTLHLALYQLEWLFVNPDDDFSEWSFYQPLHVKWPDGQRSTFYTTSMQSLFDAIDRCIRLVYEDDQAEWTNSPLLQYLIAQTNPVCN